MYTIRTHGLRSLASAALGALVSVGLAYPVSAEDASDASSELAEVVITAERTTQNLQRVPISATVLSGQQLDNE
jgi:iron complex outermembrane recepter protein